MIFLGTSACVQLNQFEEAIMWCEKGLAVSFNADNRTLTKNIVQSEILFSFIHAYLCHLTRDKIQKLSSLSFHNNFNGAVFFLIHEQTKNFANNMTFCL